MVCSFSGRAANFSALLLVTGGGRFGAPRGHGINESVLVSLQRRVGIGDPADAAGLAHSIHGQCGSTPQVLQPSRRGVPRETCRNATLPDHLRIRGGHRMVFRQRPFCDRAGHLPLQS